MRLYEHLEAREEIIVAVVGFKRQRNAVLEDLTPRYRAYSLWGGHIEGAGSEYVVSRETGLPWTGRDYIARPGAIPPPDVGRKTEVRWTPPHCIEEVRKNDNPLLKLHPYDNVDRYFVLVSGLLPTLFIRGWMSGEEIRERGTEWKFDQRVWVVAASALHDFPLPEDA